MSIKNACKLGVLVNAKLLKEGCIFLIARARLSKITWSHDSKKCGPLST
jgi:hypothetical protein